jgi:Type II site-specific deoxyribonuclease
MVSRIHHLGIQMSDGKEKLPTVDEAIASLRILTPIQLDVITSIIDKFSEEQAGEHLRDEFLNKAAFEYFSTRLAAHHASSSVQLKKENFEHILEQSFRRTGHAANLTDNMVHRGADLEVDGRRYSLKTEAAKSLNRNAITISKLMEARWIRDLKGTRDVPAQVRDKIVSHLDEYDQIFMLRSYGDDERVRYDLHEIPKAVITEAGKLIATDFGPLTQAGGTSANVLIGGTKAFRLVLDGSVEKVTISGLNVKLCPLHAWWELGRPG